MIAQFYNATRSKIMRRITKLTLLIGALVPHIVRGLDLDFETITPLDPTLSGGGAGTVGFVLDRFINFALGLLILLAVAMVLYIAYGLLFSDGEAEKFKTARRYLFYVAMAIGIGLLSKGLVFIVFELAVEEDQLGDF